MAYVASKHGLCAIDLRSGCVLARDTRGRDVEAMSIGSTLYEVYTIDKEDISKWEFESGKASNSVAKIDEHVWRAGQIITLADSRFAILSIGGGLRLVRGASEVGSWSGIANCGAWVERKGMLYIGSAQWFADVRDKAQVFLFDVGDSARDAFDERTTIKPLKSLVTHVMPLCLDVRVDGHLAVGGPICRGRPDQNRVDVMTPEGAVESQIDCGASNIIALAFLGGGHVRIATASRLFVWSTARGAVVGEYICREGIVAVAICKGKNVAAVFAGNKCVVCDINPG